jgi:hypothetical protein
MLRENGVSPALRHTLASGMSQHNNTADLTDRSRTTDQQDALFFLNLFQQSTLHMFRID